MCTSVVGKRGERAQECPDLGRRLREIGVELELAERPVVVEQDRALPGAGEAARDPLLDRVVDRRRPLRPRGRGASSGRAASGSPRPSAGCRDPRRASPSSPAGAAAREPAARAPSRAARRRRRRSTGSRAARPGAPARRRRAPRGAALRASVPAGPGSDWQSTNSWATRFIPSRSAVTIITSARR